MRLESGRRLESGMRLENGPKLESEPRPNYGRRKSDGIKKRENTLKGGEAPRHQLTSMAPRHLLQERSQHPSRITGELLLGVLGLTTRKSRTGPQSARLSTRALLMARSEKSSSGSRRMGQQLRWR